MATEPGTGFPPIDLERRDLVPHEDEALISWAYDNVTAFAERLRGIDPRTPAWSWTPDQTAGFWMRRAALEAAVHLWDAEGLGERHGVVPSALAADGLDELVDNYSAAFAMGAPFDGAALVIHATDIGREWPLCPPGSFVEGDREVRGTASDLFLRLWGRHLGSFAGDVEALDKWAALGERMG